MPEQQVHYRTDVFFDVLSDDHVRDLFYDLFHHDLPIYEIYHDLYVGHHVYLGFYLFLFLLNDGHGLSAHDGVYL